MKSKLGLALFAAALLHAALFSAVAYRPKAPVPASDDDFIAHVPFFDESSPFMTGEATPTLVSTVPVTTRETFADALPPRVGSSICAVHQTEMAVFEVFLSVDRHGKVIDPPGIHLSNPHDPPDVLRVARFPNARSWAWATDTQSRHNARLYVCAECERAEREWKQTQENMIE